MNRPYALVLCIITAACVVACSRTDLHDVDLGPVLIQDGDLPAGVYPGQLRDTLPEMFHGLPQPDRTLYRQFEREGKQSGGVALLLYRDHKVGRSAYDSIVKGFGKSETTSVLTSTVQSVSGIGEEGAALTATGKLLDTEFNFTDLAFLRGDAIVQIRFGDTSDLEDAVAYAKRLDKRLGVDHPLPAWWSTNIFGALLVLLLLVAVAVLFLQKKNVAPSTVSDHRANGQPAASFLSKGMASGVAVAASGPKDEQSKVGSSGNALSVPSYRVIVEGKVLSGFHPGEVRHRLAALIKRSEEAAGNLLSGRPFTVKSKVNQSTAMQYVQTLLAIGVSCHAERENFNVSVAAPNQLSIAGKVDAPRPPEPTVTQSRETFSLGSIKATWGDAVEALQTGDLSQRQLLGLAGSIILLVGVFTPIISIPILGNITYFRGGSWDGSTVLVLALISTILALAQRRRWLLWTGTLSAGTLLITFLTFQWRMHEVQASLADNAAKLKGNPFGGFAQGLLEATARSIQFQWGWAVLVVGACVILAAALRGPKDES